MKNIDFIKKAKKYLEKDAEQIIKEVSRDICYNDEPKLFHYMAQIKDASTNTYPDDSVASGTSFSKQKALAKLFGETLERFCLTTQPKKIIKASYSDLLTKAVNALNPDECNPYDKQQFKKINPNVKNLKNEKFFWVEGKELLTQEKILIPAQLIFLSSHYQHHEPKLESPISTGAACGTTLKQALYGGINEIVERDAYMLNYLLKIPGRVISLENTKDKDLLFIQNYIQRYRLELFLLDFTTDLAIPSVGAIIIDKTGLGPAVSMGLKAGFDTKQIIIGAIEEAFMVRSWIRDKFIYFEPNFKLKKGIETVEERAFYWFDPSMIKKLNFWLDGEKIPYEEFKKKYFSKEKDSFSRLVESFKKRSIPIYYVNIATKSMEKENFFIIKAIIPLLQPMYLDEGTKYFGKKRLKDYQKHMGIKDELNAIPHPFL